MARRLPPRGCLPGRRVLACPSLRCPSLRADEPEDAPFRWNDYVLAVIAVFEHDRATFDRHRDRVAAFANAHDGNALNLRFLDRLGARFDAGYAGALHD